MPTVSLMYLQKTSVHAKSRRLQSVTQLQLARKLSTRLLRKLNSLPQRTKSAVRQLTLRTRLKTLFIRQKSSSAKAVTRFLRMTRTQSTQRLQLLKRLSQRTMPHSSAQLRKTSRRLLTMLPLSFISRLLRRAVLPI